MLDWIYNNVQWIFSGIGVFIITLLIGYFNKHKKKSSFKTIDKINSQNVSIQASGDIHFYDKVDFQNSTDDTISHLSQNDKINDDFISDYNFLDKNYGNIFLEKGINKVLSKSIINSINTIVIIDIDNQTGINNTYGMKVGDEVIKRIAIMLKNNFNSEYYGRWGADSFYVFLPDRSIMRAIDIMQNTCKQIRITDWTDIALGLYVTCSAGIAQLNSSESTQNFIVRACEGMKKAKTKGGNQVCLAPEYLPNEYKKMYKDFDSP